MGLTKFSWSGVEGGVISIKGFIYQVCLLPLCGGDKAMASAGFAIIFVLINWCVGYILYKKRIYIKL